MPGSGIDKKFGEEYVDEAKIDKIDPKNKRKRRNEVTFGKQTKPYDPPGKAYKNEMGKFLQKQRKERHDKMRGVKTKGMGEEVVLEADKKGKGSGTKDACYHKVKSRYSVWPSAYASGALVKCRKVGAKNWGNSSKKEEVNWDFEMKSFGAYAAECWKTHKQVGTKMKGGKVVPNCVPKNEERTPAAGDTSFDIMRPGGANSPFNADGTPKKKFSNVPGTGLIRKSAGISPGATDQKPGTSGFKEEKKKLSNTSPLSDRVSNWSKTKIKEGVGVKRDQNMPYIPNQKIKTVKDKPLKKVPYGALAQSYVPQGDVIEMADFSLDDLEKPMKKEYDITNPRERAIYSRLKKAGKNPLIKKVD